MGNAPPIMLNIALKKKPPMPMKLVAEKIMITLSHIMYSRGSALSMAAPTIIRMLHIKPRIEKIAKNS